MKFLAGMTFMAALMVGAIIASSVCVGRACVYVKYFALPF